MIPTECQQNKSRIPTEYLYQQSTNRASAAVAPPPAPPPAARPAARQAGPAGSRGVSVAAWGVFYCADIWLKSGPERSGEANTHV